MECTGAHLTRASLQTYFDQGVKKVVVSAPVKDEPPVLNVVMGCNDVSSPRRLAFFPVCPIFSQRLLPRQLQKFLAI